MNKDLIQLVYDLMPGFLAAWAFYGLTAWPRRDYFERIVQALLFTGIIKVLMMGVRWLVLWIGQYWSCGHWTDNLQFTWAMVMGLAFGIVVSAMANRDMPHKWLRWVGTVKRLKWLQITKKNAFPSEWFSAFQREERYVVLHLKDERRLYGWAEEWPNEPTGHFLITQPYWLLDDNTMVPLPQAKRLIIDATMVEMVEQLTEDDERKATPSEIEDRQRPLVELAKQKKGGAEGSASAASSAAAVAATPAVKSESEPDSESEASETNAVVEEKSATSSTVAAMAAISKENDNGKGDTANATDTASTAQRPGD